MKISKSLKTLKILATSASLVGLVIAPTGPTPPSVRRSRGRPRNDRLSRGDRNTGPPRVQVGDPQGQGQVHLR